MFDDHPSPLDYQTNAWTYHNHNWGVSPETFGDGPNGDPKLHAFYKPTSTSVSENGEFEFVSTFEAYDYPFMGSIFHPEKHGVIFNSSSVDQSWDTIDANQYFSEKFVSLARQNTNSFGNNNAIQEAVIHNYELIVYDGYYEEVYVFE